MRNELQQIEKIEQYLKGLLPDAERKAFETQIANDPALREEVKLQQELMKGIERAALKQQVQQAGRQFRQWRQFKKWGGAGLGIIVVTAAILYFSYHYAGNTGQAGYAGNTLPAFNELGVKQWADADRNITAQQFVVDAGSDTVIETKGGIVLSVPANGFLDDNGQPATGKINLVLKEALDPAAIMKAGLSTKSGDQLLESGGMFFIDARQGEKILKINPSNGIYAEVPADTLKSGMQVYSGRRMPDGTIDWVNPKPLEHDLMPVDILSLNFYPPRYLDSLKRWGYDITNKKFTDSLYYSFAWLFGRSTRPPGAEGVDEPVNESNYIDFGKATVAVPKDSLSKTERDALIRNNKVNDSSPKRVSVTAADSFSEFHPLHDCAINPAKIKTIWSNKFQNTLLSTREFEERLQWIHKIGINALLDLYIRNLDKSLYDIDTMAIRMAPSEGKEIFELFAARHDGKVKNGSKHFEQLRKYYEKKAKAFTEAISKTQNDYWNKQAALDRTAESKQEQHQNDSTKRIAKNFEEEFDLNFKEAIRQLGYSTEIPVRWSRGVVYRVMVVNTGWCNIDRAVETSTLNRTTLDYTDPQTGKKAVIKYLPVSFQVANYTEYDRLYVYLLPGQLSSFMLVNGSNGKYEEKLDELMSYKLVCIGWKGEQAFYYSMDNVRPMDYPPFALAQTGNDELERLLNKAGNKTQASGLVKENAYFNFERADQKRQKHNRDLEELSGKLREFLFPCYLPSDTTPAPSPAK